MPPQGAIAWPSGLKIDRGAARRFQPEGPQPFVTAAEAREDELGSLARTMTALVETLRGAPDLDAALRRIEWARAPDRWTMIATTDFLARSFTWKLLWP